MRPVSVVVLAALGALACVTTKATVLDPQIRLAPICPEGVMLFTSADRVGKAFTEIAVLTSTGDESFASEDKMRESQRKKAAQLGANGVILGDVRDPSTGAKVASALLGTSADRRAEAVAIYIAEDSVRVREACKYRA